MGTGTFRAATGKFNLILSLRHNADAARLDEWCTSFERASALLFDTSDGQHQLGDVHVCNNSTGGHYADAWLTGDELQQAASAGGYPGMGNPGVHMTFHPIHRFRPFVVVHEFGHHAYGLYDEVQPNGMAGGCTGSTVQQACVMEWTWLDGDRFGANGDGGALQAGAVSEFCVLSNHNTVNDNDQERLNHEPCWQTMVDRYVDLVLPAAVPALAMPGGADPIRWILLAAEQRFVLVVDRSGSMAGNKLAEARFGADWWADIALVGDRLGVVSFSHTVVADYPLHEITGDADRLAAQAAIGLIAAGGLTSIGGGLREGLNQALSPGHRAATQVVVLLTDGYHNSGEAPGSVLPDLVDDGARVYVIGIGPSVDANLLQQIATTTGGTLYRIDPALSQADQEFEIRLALLEISGIVRDNGGLITIRPGSTNPGEVGEDVYVEPGSEMATFALTWKNPEDLLYLELESPDGQVITLGATPPGVRPIYSGRPYVGFQVEKPLPGTWKLTVLPQKVAEVAEYRLFAFSQNPHIDGGLISPWRFYRQGDPIPLQLQVYFDRPVTGLRVSGTALLPGGERIPLHFDDSGNADLGDALPGDGLYSTLFHDTRRRGIYTFEVLAESDGDSAAYARGCELTGDAGPQDGEQHIPPFRRQFRLALAVGEEAFPRVAIEPSGGEPGEELEVILKGHLTHFREAETAVDFGPGVKAGEVHVLDKHNARVTITVDPGAEPGPRTVVVSTPLYRERIEVEGGFVVAGGQAQD